MDRRHPILPFDPQRFVGFFGEEGRGLTAELLTGGACNSNYLVTRETGEKVVCRIHSRGEPQAEQYIAQLARRVVPSVEHLWVGDEVAVMAYIEGDHFTATPDLMQQAGRLIAQMATVTFDRSGMIGCDGKVTPFSWGSYRDALLFMLDLDPVTQRLDAAVIAALREIVAVNAAILDDFECSHNLVHGDFSTDNLLVRQGRIVGVLDWEFSHSGSSFTDIGNLLRHFPANFEAELATGLRDGGFDLPTDWRFRAAFIDLLSHLEFLTSQRSEDFKKECVKRVEAFVLLGRQDTQPVQR